jgi:hypothetical protein
MNDMAYTSGKWTVHQWRDGAGNLTSSYEIHCGDTLIVADLEKSECDEIVDAHNDTLTAAEELQVRTAVRAEQAQIALAAERKKRKALIAI